MLTPTVLEQYRRMSPRERIAEMRELIDFAERALRVKPPAEIARCLAALDAERSRSREALLSGLARLDAETEHPEAATTTLGAAHR